LNIFISFPGISLAFPVRALCPLRCQEGKYEGPRPKERIKANQNLLCETHTHLEAGRCCEIVFYCRTYECVCVCILGENFYVYSSRKKGNLTLPICCCLKPN